MLLAGIVSALTIGKRGTAFAANADEDAKVRAAVDDAVKPVLAEYEIPGMAVGVTIAGRRHFVEYGSASVAQQIPVTRDTLFELGSISKTFTATLATLAEREGKLSLYDKVGTYMPELKGRPAGEIRLLDLGTHTAGGFPLQLPAGVKTEQQLIAWYRAWKPKYPAGTQRTYANPSIALLGIVTARAMGQSFASLAEGRLFLALALRRTYITVPETEIADYAWGTNRNGKPVRMEPSPISTEAYGVKSNAVDMLRYLEVSMGQGNDELGDVAEPVASAVIATHTGYYQTDTFIQDLIWEQYPLPTGLDTMTEGNASRMWTKSHPVTELKPPMPPRIDVRLNKTGSNDGFGAYVVYVPERKLGIVLLANKAYPNDVKTTVGWQVMEKMAG